MKSAVFVSGLCGVVAGLLFGMLVWGGAGEPGALPSAGVKADAELLATLRDLRAAVDRLAARDALPTGPASATASGAAAPAPVQPLTAAPSADDYRVVLDQAVAALREAANAGSTGFADQPVSPDAGDRLKRAFASDKAVYLEIFGCSPRGVFAKLGRPSWVVPNDGQVVWHYTDDATRQDFEVRFMDGYVSSYWLRQQ